MLRRWPSCVPAKSARTGCGSSFRSWPGSVTSPTAKVYALPDLTAARAYLAHDLLGARLRAATRAVLLHAPGTTAPRSLDAIFGYPDNINVHSSMTLFHRAASDEALFATALAAFFNGREDAATLARLQPY